MFKVAIFCILDVFSSFAHFHKITSHWDRRVYDQFESEINFSMLSSTTSESQNPKEKALKKLRNGIYKRNLKSMVDNLTFGVSGHSKRRTLKDFKETKPFKKEESTKTNYRFKQFKLFHQNYPAEKI